MKFKNYIETLVKALENDPSVADLDVVCADEFGNIEEIYIPEDNIELLKLGILKSGAFIAEDCMEEHFEKTGELTVLNFVVVN